VVQEQYPPVHLEMEAMDALGRKAKMQVMVEKVRLESRTKYIVYFHQML